MAREAAQVRDPRTQRKLTRLLGFIVFFSVLNGTMFNVSIPDIAADFRLMPSDVSWVMTVYIITFALGAVTYGKLADIFQMKDLITIGLILLCAGSIIGLFAMWYPVLIAARFVQASGGSSIPALAMLISTQYFPSDIKGRVLGVIASTVAFSAGVGPIIGGFITGAFHWRYLFLFSLATLFAIPSFRRLLPEEEKHDHRFDAMGALLMVGGAASLLLFVTESIWWLLLLGMVLLLAFAVHIRRAESPFIRPGLFRNRPYRNTVVAAALSIGTVFGMMFMTPIMLRDINGLGADWIGLVLFPGAMSAAFLGRPGGRLVDRVGGARVAYLAIGLLVAGYFLVSTFSGLSPVVIAVALVVCYTGFSFIQSSLAHTVSDTLPRAESGIGMGIYNMCFFMSGAFGAALLGRLLDLKTASFRLNPLAACAGAWLFSNLYLLLAALALGAACLLYITFGGAGKAATPKDDGR
jgi:DHA2 family metal-tetracycline-proton antiporter-like MFS transporter